MIVSRHPARSRRIYATSAGVSTEDPATPLRSAQDDEGRGARPAMLTQDDEGMVPLMMTGWNPVQDGEEQRPYSVLVVEAVVNLREL